MKAFLLSLTSLTIIILSAGFFWSGTLPTFYYPSLILLYASTAGLYYYLLKIRETRPDFFVQFYLLTIALKLLAYLSYLGVVAWRNPDQAALNIVFFMVIYVIFTAVEIGFLWWKIGR